MADFTFLSTDFNATEITVVANTRYAKEYLAECYGVGFVSLKVRKSEVQEFVDSFQFQGLSYN